MSANFTPESSPVLPAAQSNLSQYLAPAVLVGSHTIDATLPVMKTANLYTAMVLKVANKVPVWGYTLWLVYFDQSESDPGILSHDM